MSCLLARARISRSPIPRFLVPYSRLVLPPIIYRNPFFPSAAVWVRGIVGGRLCLLFCFVLPSAVREAMASWPRSTGNQDVGQDRRGGGTGSGVKDILATCPASMGSGLLVDDTESGRRQRVHAVARIKGLLEQVKENIKVRRVLNVTLASRLGCVLDCLGLLLLRCCW